MQQTQSKSKHETKINTRSSLEIVYNGYFKLYIKQKAWKKHRLVTWNGVT